MRALLLVVVAALTSSDTLWVRLAPVEDHFYRSDVQTSVDGDGDGKYHFTSGWHLQHMALWSKLFADLRGAPNLRYLEVGVFEGRSLLWMLENVLTDPSSTATVIDVFMDDYEATFDANLEASGAAARVTKIVGPSGRELRKLSSASYDIIYIDGSHTADDVLLDATLSWDLLAPGGVLVFDDYAWTGRRGAGPLPAALRPALAIDAFVAANAYALEVVHRGYQLVVRKRENPCVPKDYCTPIGRYNYFWRNRELWTRTGGRIELGAGEVEIVERIAHAMVPGRSTLDAADPMREEPEVARLAERLGLF